MDFSQFSNESIYEVNSFRLLQIPVFASDSEIRKRKTELELAVKLQRPYPDGKCKIYPIDLSADHLDINKIASDLQDPVKRFYQEFFWFWPIREGDDPALSALSIGNITNAIEIWENYYSGPREKAICLHNLAIYYHFMGLRSPNETSTRDLQENWSNVFTKWRDLSCLLDYWSLLKNRVRQINDPRLKESQVTDLQQSILGLLEYSNTQKIIDLIEKSSLDYAEVLMANNKAENRNISIEIRKHALSKNRERLLTAIQMTEAQVNSDTSHSDASIEALLTSGYQQYKIIKAVVPDDKSEIVTLGDGLIDTAVQGINQYFRKTDDWVKSIELLQMINIRHSEMKKNENIVELISTYKEFGKKQNYWHCKGYYSKSLPQDLFDSLENAYTSFEREDYQSTINMLENISSKYCNQPDLIKNVINPPFALSLSRLSDKHFHKGIEYLQQERLIISSILGNIRSKNVLCMSSFNAVYQNQIEIQARRGLLYCMSCLVNISYGRYYVGETDIGDSKTVKFVICESCYYKDKRDIESRKESAKIELIKSRDSLIKANQKHPKNQVVSENLEYVNSLLDKIYGISSPMINQVTKPTSSSPNPRPPISTSQPQSGSNAGNNGCLNVIAIIGIIAVVVFCLSTLFTNLNSLPFEANNIPRTLIPSNSDVTLGWAQNAINLFLFARL